VHADCKRPVRVGLSGWNYAHWRNGVFYPPRLPASRWLEFYVERFDTVEVNSTFYRLPRRDAVARWVEQTPADFLFAVKASRYLTHIKRLLDLGPGLERFWSGSSRCSARRSSGRSSGSCLPRSAVTTSVSQALSLGCRASCGIASSSGTPRGSWRTRMRSYASTGWRSRSATGPR
jgi:uncharacterized protein DUF72